MIELELIKADLNNFHLIYTWCSDKEIYEWFEQRLLTESEIINKYQKKIVSKEQDLYFIKYNGEKIGLVQIYKYHDKFNEYLNKYHNIYEFDLFINKRNQGIGTMSIKIIDELIFNKYAADAIILRPFKRNIRAIKCYHHNNYRDLYTYSSKDTLGNPEEVLVLIKEKI